MNKVYPFIHSRIIRFGETDPAGIVYTPRFADFCADAAEIWFRDYLKFDWYQINAHQGMGTPAVHMEFDFLSPLRANDLLDITVLLAKVGGTTVALDFKGHKMQDTKSENVLCFTAHLVWCFYNNASARSMRIPDEQRALIENYKANCLK